MCAGRVKHSKREIEKQREPEDIHNIRMSFVPSQPESPFSPLWVLCIAPPERSSLVNNQADVQLVFVVGIRVVCLAVVWLWNCADDDDDGWIIFMIVAKRFPDIRLVYHSLYELC